MSYKVGTSAAIVFLNPLEEERHALRRGTEGFCGELGDPGSVSRHTAKLRHEQIELVKGPGIVGDDLAVEDSDRREDQSNRNTGPVLAGSAMDEGRKVVRCHQQCHDIDDRPGGVLQITEIVRGNPLILVLGGSVILPLTAGAERQVGDAFFDRCEVFVGSFGDLAAAAEIYSCPDVQNVDHERCIIGQ